MDTLKRDYNMRGTAEGILQVYDPDDIDWPILAWSVVHREKFKLPEKVVVGRVFATSAKLHHWQAEHQNKLRWLQQTIVLACDVEQCHLPVHLVDWKTLLLVRSALKAV
ncbi:MAG: hypothetical protein WBB68_01560 [Candidatus Moraniibacteriota bacterium]